MLDNEDEALSLGSCCVCEGHGPTVRNVFMLDKLGVIPGHGWGCATCKIPPDGASVVLCDGCANQNLKFKYACRGYPASDGRIDIKVLTAPFYHNPFLHMESWSSSSPQEGEPECTCALCFTVIGAPKEDSKWDLHDPNCVGCDVCNLAIRLNAHKKEIRFHQKCFTEVHKMGFVTIDKSNQVVH